MGLIDKAVTFCLDNPLLLCALSALGFSIQALFVKFLSIANFPSFQIIIFRGFCQFTGVFIVLCFKRIPVKKWLGTSKLEYSVLFGRGLFGFGGIGFGFYALNLTSLANVQVSQQTVPVWTAILSTIFLSEPLRLAEMITTLFTGAGVCLIFRPAFIFGSGDDDFEDDDSENNLTSGALSNDSLGILFGVIGSACAACAYCFIRMLGTSVSVPWPTVMLAQALSQMFYSVPTLYIVNEQWQLPNLNQLLYLLGCGVLGFSAQVCMTIGMMRSNAAAASLVRQSGIVYSFIFDAIAVPSDTLSLSTVMGAVIIVVPVSMLGYVRSVEAAKKKEEEETAVQLEKAEEQGGVLESSSSPLSAELETEKDETSDDADMYIEPNNLPKKTNKPQSTKKGGGGYTTLSRVASDDDLEDDMGRKHDEVVDDELPTSFGFRWGTSTSSGLNQSWQSLTDTNLDEEDSHIGWDTWGDRKPRSSMINSMQTSIRSTTNSVLQLVPPSVFKGTKRGQRSSASNYQGIESNEQGDGLAIGTGLNSEVEIASGDTPIISHEDIEDDDDDDDVEFGV